MAHIAYYRVSTTDQSIESQRQALIAEANGGAFDREFKDEGVSGGVPASQRPGFASLTEYIREGDTLHVYAVDRLGRDALDIQSTVRALLLKGVAVNIKGLGLISRGVGELILAVLAQIADMEKARINERTALGRETARASLQATGKTHHGKASLGRPVGRVAGGQQVDPKEVILWRSVSGQSIAKTAAHFGLSVSTVKRYCAG